MGKQLVNFITCDCKSSAPIFVIYKAGTGANPCRIGDNYLTHKLKKTWFDIYLHYKKIFLFQKLLVKGGRI